MLLYVPSAHSVQIDAAGNKLNVAIGQAVQLMAPGCA